MVKLLVWSSDDSSSGGGFNSGMVVVIVVVVVSSLSNDYLLCALLPNNYSKGILQCYAIEKDYSHSKMLEYKNSLGVTLTWKVDY